MANNWWVNGYRLDDPAGRWRVMEGTKVPAPGAMRLVSTTIPNRMGVIPQPALAAEPFMVSINLMVTDAGKPGHWSQVQYNYDTLMGIIRPFYSLSTLEYMPDGSDIRWAYARLSGEPSVVFDRGAMTYDVTIVFEVPGGVWKDRTAQIMPANDLSKIKGGSAPIQDVKFLVANPPQLLAVRDVVSATQMAWTGTAPSGKALLLEPNEYKASYVTPGTWTHSDDDASFGLDISPFGFSMYPSRDGTYTLQATGGTWQVRAMRSFA